MATQQLDQQDEHLLKDISNKLSTPTGEHMEETLEELAKMLKKSDLRPVFAKQGGISKYELILL
jgi:hypothetical protein